MKLKQTNIKVLLFFFLSLFVFYTTVAALPEEVFYDFHRLYSWRILYSTITLGSVFCLNFDTLKRRHWINAVVFGALSMGHRAPLSSNFVVGVTVFFVYLAAVSLNDESEYKIKMFTSLKVRDMTLNMVIILVVLILFTVSWFTNHFQGVEFGLHIHPFGIAHALAPSVSEEIIFRLFLFSLMIKLNRGLEVNTITLLVIMVVPFALLHAIDETIRYGFTHPSAYGIWISVVPMAVIISLLAMKRGLFTAMGVHFAMNLPSLVLSQAQP